MISKILNKLKLTSLCFQIVVPKITRVEGENPRCCGQPSGRRFRGYRISSEALYGSCARARRLIHFEKILEFWEILCYFYEDFEQIIGKI